MLELPYMPFIYIIIKGLSTHILAMSQHGTYSPGEYQVENF